MLQFFFFAHISIQQILSNLLNCYTHLVVVVVGWWFSCSVVSDSLRPQGLWPARLLYPWDFSQARILEWAAVSSPGDLFDPGIEPEPPAFQADSTN